MSPPKQTGTWYPKLEGLKLPGALVRGMEQAYALIYSLRDVFNNLAAAAVVGKTNLTDPNVVTKVSAAGQIVEGGITDESAAGSDRLHISPIGDVGIGGDPRAKLDVVIEGIGRIQLQGTITPAGNGVAIDCMNPTGSGFVPLRISASTYFMRLPPGDLGIGGGQLWYDPATGIVHYTP